MLYVLSLIILHLNQGPPYEYHQVLSLNGMLLPPGPNQTIKGSLSSFPMPVTGRTVSSRTLLKRFGQDEHLLVVYYG